MEKHTTKQKSLQVNFSCSSDRKVLPSSTPCELFYTTQWHFLGQTLLGGVRICSLLLSLSGTAPRSGPQLSLSSRGRHRHYN